MEKKLLYIANINLSDNKSGITRKVLSQYRNLSSYFDAYLIGYDGRNIRLITPTGTKLYESKSTRPSSFLRETAEQVCTENNIGLVYIRRMEINPSVLKLLRILKNRNAVIIWEIPTYPYDFENKSFLNPIQKLRAKIRLKEDKLFRTSLRRYVDRIVTFSNYEEIYGIPTIVTGNGVDVDEIRERKIENHGHEIHMIAVAVMRPWHAYDRLIKGMNDYYVQGGTRNIVFHVVGDGLILSDYRKLVDDYGLSEHVIFYGSKTKEEIDEIYDKADIAVESLGWHRSKVSVGTSIKTREYVSKGLPIIASSPMDIFPDGWEYAYYAPIDESNIDMNDVIEFYDNLFIEKSKESLAKEIRKIAYERCDMKTMMKPIADYLLKQSK